MRVTVYLEHRFDRTPDNQIWSLAAFGYPFWQRYLDVFDDVEVVARVRDVPTPPDQALRVDGPNVRVAPMPYYIGPRQYMTQLPALRSQVRATARRADAVIARLSSQVASLALPVLQRAGHPYGIEVVGDPYDVFAPGVVSHPLRPLLRQWLTRQLKQQAAGAAAAAYVTDRTLQARYPCSRLMVGVSDVELPDAAFAPSPRSGVSPGRPVTAAFIGSLDQLYKAPDTLLAAVARCRAAGLDLRLTMIGDGRFRPSLEQLASQLGVRDAVTFAGFVTAGQPVRSVLDHADLFVLPSRTEGLPRAMIEAMARGLPCIGSTAGGIPELLAADDLVPPGDVDALAAKLLAVARDPQRLRAMSARNLARARDYHEDALRERRHAFYRHVEHVTRAWQVTQGVEPATTWATGEA